MPRTRNPARALRTVLVCIAAVLAIPSSSDAQSAPSSARRASDPPASSELAQLRSRYAIDSLSANVRDGVIRGRFRITGKLSATPAQRSASSAEAAASTFLDHEMSLFGLSDWRAKLHHESSLPEASGALHVFYRQTEAGVPVRGGEIRFHTDASGQIVSITGQILPVSPAMHAAAEAATHGGIVSKAQIEGAASEDARATLAGTSVTAKAELLLETDEPYLRWVVEVMVPGEGRWTYQFDAATGSLIEKRPTNQSAGATEGANAVQQVPVSVTAGPAVVSAIRSRSSPQAIPAASLLYDADHQALLSDGFESGFPGNWLVLDDNGTTGGNVVWDDVSNKAFSGTSSAWCAGGGTDARLPANGYADNMRTWMIQGPFSLSGALAASFSLERWMNTESGYDYFSYLVSVDGQNFSGYQLTGNESAWHPTSLDLSSVPTLGNLLGAPQVWVAVLFQSDTYVEAEGVYVDDVKLQVLNDAAASATPAIGTGTGLRPASTWPHLDTLQLGPTSSHAGQYVLVDRSRRAASPLHGHNGAMGALSSIFTLSWTGANDGFPSFPRDADDAWTSNDTASAVDANGNATKVYDFLHGQMGLNGIDGVGGSMESIVDSTSTAICPNNAYWDGHEVNFCAQNSGLPYSTALDAVAHEWGHAVTDLASLVRGPHVPLDYQGESGALNESFSDWMGVRVEAYGGNKNWTMGESAAAPLRDLSNPASVGEPAIVGDPHWYRLLDCVPQCDRTLPGANDCCWVHENIGVPNKMFQLLSDGSGDEVMAEFGGVPVAGLGLERAFEIGLSANLYYWSSDTDFLGARNAMLDAAAPADAASVQDAWAAVGVGAPSTATTGLYVHDRDYHLGLIDLQTGNTQVIGTMSEILGDIAMSPDGKLYGSNYDSLFLVDRNTAALTLVGPFGVHQVNALTFSPAGVLYAATLDSDSGAAALYTVNVATGAATKVGTLGYQSDGDLAFGRDGKLYMTATSGDLVVVDTGTGAATKVGQLDAVSVYGLATDLDGLTYAVSDTTVYRVNTTTGLAYPVLSFAGQGVGAAYGATFAKAQTCANGKLDQGEECDPGVSGYVPGAACAQTCLWVPCGRPVNPFSPRPRTADALFVLRAAVQSTSCVLSVCDVNGDGKVSVPDALVVLKVAVGGNSAMKCPAP